MKSKILPPSRGFFALSPNIWDDRSIQIPIRCPFALSKLLISLKSLLLFWHKNPSCDIKLLPISLPLSMEMYPLLMRWLSLLRPSLPSILFQGFTPPLSHGNNVSVLCFSMRVWRLSSLGFWCWRPIFLHIRKSLWRSSLQSDFPKHNLHSLRHSTALKYRQ